jgi:hypothetical protein
MPVQLDLLDNISAYRPVRCTATQLFVLPVRKAIVNIIVNGSAIAQQSYDMKEVTPGVFETIADVQSKIQDFLSPDQNTTTVSSSLGTNGQPYKVLNTDLFCSVGFSVDYMYELPNGKLDLLALAETAGDYSVFTATVQNFGSMNLDEYAPVFGAISKLLTNSPKQLDICLQDSYYLSAFTSGLGLAGNTSARVQTFDSSGTLIEEGRLDFLPLLTFTQQDQVTAGVGPANLLTTVYDEGAVNITNPNISYYEVCYGVFNLASFLPTSETYRFNIVPCCDSYKVRLYWLNNKGGFDAVTMKYTERSIEKTSTTIQRPLEWGPAPNYHSPLYKGKYPVNIEATESFNLEYCLKDKLEGVWIQELLYSPEVYVEIDGGPLQSAIVIDGTGLTDLKNDIGLIELTIQAANTIITMRN